MKPTPQQIAAYLRSLERHDLLEILNAVDALERRVFVTRRGRTISRYAHIRCPWCRFEPDEFENRYSNVGLHNYSIEHWTCEQCGKRYSIECYNLLVVEKE